jgi:eukaryotic-like serine/threonine-protein kinase
VALTPGTRLGPYEVIALIGAGGMGEVYRAHDTKLSRDVALKVLPEAFSLDGDRIARFRREAQVLASLNHSNIANIYGVEDSGNTPALVLELVEGPTLADRITRGPIALDEALPIARQIAEALEAAHEQGIIHRDLKPANIKVRDDGTVKVLDFGLAKMLETASAAAALTMSPTLSVQATLAGIVLGTAAYMSPEQARGKPVDRRADIWAFGCVLFEMLTGRRAFDAGDSISDAVASILKNEPDWSLLPPNITPGVRILLRRCLQKDPQKRLPHIGIVRLEIAEGSTVPTASDRPDATTLSRRSLSNYAASTAIAAIVGGAIAGGAIWTLRPSQVPPTVTRFTLALPEDQIFAAAGFPIVAISPDGARMVYSANQRLYVRTMSELAARPIAGAEQKAGFLGGPVFSPDGKWLAFWTGSDPTTFTLKKIAVDGGVAVTICQAAPGVAGVGMSWEGDSIVFGHEKGVMRVLANGGQPQLLAAVKPGEVAQAPQVLPGGDAVLFTIARRSGASGFNSFSWDWDRAQVVVQSLRSGERKTLLERGNAAMYLPTGHLVYAAGESIFAVPFDLKHREVTGGPIPVVEGVRRGIFAAFNSGLAHFSVSANGTLVWVPATSMGTASPRDLAIADRRGSAEALKLPARPYGSPRISPDGRQVAFGTDDEKSANLWIYELSGAKSARQLTLEGHNRFPIWSGDSQRVAFQSDREGDRAIFWQRADGTASAVRLTKPEPGAEHTPQAWSPDGKTLLLDVSKGTTRRLSTFSIDDGKVTPVVEVRDSVFPLAGTFSPDGRWVAYTAMSSSTASISAYVIPFPATGARYSIADGMYFPAWSRDGKEIVFDAITDTGIVSQFAVVKVTTQPTFTFGNPELLPSGGLLRDLSSGRNFDIMPDGKRFVGTVDAQRSKAGASAAERIQVVLNWSEELKQRVPVK